MTCNLGLEHTRASTRAEAIVKPRVCLKKYTALIGIIRLTPLGPFPASLFWRLARNLAISSMSKSVLCYLVSIEPKQGASAGIGRFTLTSTWCHGLREPG